MNFPKNCPFEDCSSWHFSGFAQFSVLTYFHYFGFFGIILSRSMGENSVILKICPLGYTSLSKSCIWSFCHFCPMHNYLLRLIWKIQLFLAILEKSLPENHASVLFCYFGIHSKNMLHKSAIYRDCFNTRIQLLLNAKKFSMKEDLHLQKNSLKIFNIRDHP